MFLIRDSSSDIFAISRFLFFSLSFSSENKSFLFFVVTKSLASATAFHNRAWQISLLHNAARKSVAINSALD